MGAWALAGLLGLALRAERIAARWRSGAKPEPESGLGLEPEPEEEEEEGLPSEAELKRLYDELNEQYFDGKLPPSSQVEILWKDWKTDRVLARCCVDGSCPIRLHKSFHKAHPDQVRVSLLHEMVHMYLQNPAHDEAFCRFIRKIPELKQDYEFYCARR